MGRPVPSPEPTLIQPTRALLFSLLLLAATGCGTQEGRIVHGGAASDADTLASLPPDIAHALRALPHAEVKALHRDGIPAFVIGNLGSATVTTGDEAGAQLAPALAQIAPVFRLTGDALHFLAAERDDLGQTHARYAQVKNGLEVVGGDLIVHLDAEGTVFAVNGEARDGVQVPAEPLLDHAEAVEAARAQLGRDPVYAVQRLVYVLTSRGDALHLAWEILAEGEHGDLPMRDLLYVDALGGDLVDRRPQIHSALNRRIYSSNNGTSLPGSLKRTEGGALTSDAIVNLAYDNMGKAHAFYKSWFNRDSYNGNGATLHTTVHYGNKYPNAYWDGYRMVLGSGDGWQFANFAGSFDIIVHELTHAVIDYTAKLAYQNEPGALNEAWADVLAAAAEAWARGTVDANVWKIGEEIYTPQTSGDALRYMGNPKQDGISYDYYPERYTGTEDYGGVHLNSGIANLAFKLLVTGGTHPRNKTSTQVPGIGMEKGARIFYRALAQYMTSNTNFQGARTATRQAALDLYGSSEAAAVDAAWTAVGVPGGVTSGGGSGGTTTASALQNGVARTSLSGATGSQTLFTLAVPAGATNLEFSISGGTGDADLYVRFGAAPTLTQYDLRPYLNGNNESATASTATAGTWHVMVHAYAAYSGLTLTASFTPPAADAGLQNGVAVQVSGATGSEQFFTVSIPSGAQSVKVATSGGTGDADLYVRYGQKPTATAWDYRPYLNGNNESATLSPATAGTWHIRVHGYQAYSGVSLVVTWE
jgi:vibriolysin